MPVSSVRNITIGYHLAEAEAWLSSAEEGSATTHLAYAAFELRLETERIALELLARIQRGRLSGEDLEVLRSFRGTSNRIYELEGHQRTLDRKISFWNIFFCVLDVPFRLHPVNLGKLAAIWHQCSELCHVGWSFASTQNAEQYVGDTFRQLTDAAHRLRPIVDRGVAWPQPGNEKVQELIDHYVRGELDEDGVRNWISEQGLWARIIRPDGKPEFFGTAIPPSNSQK